MLEKRKFRLGIFIALFLPATAIYLPSAEANLLNVAQDGSGDFTAIQAALNAAANGDTVIVHQGTYNEDINIGHFGLKDSPTPVRKDNITLKAAPGESVEVIPLNAVNRLTAWKSLYNIDLGEQDFAGLVINGENVVIDNIKINNRLYGFNILGLNFTIYVGAANVKIQNCYIVGPSGAGHDPTITTPQPVLIGICQFSSLNEQHATGLLVDNCRVTNCLISTSSLNFFRLPGHDPNITVNQSEFFGNFYGIMMFDGGYDINECSFHNNTVGIELADGIVNLTNCTITNNKGNGILVSEFTSDENEPKENPVATIKKCIIADNGSPAGSRQTDLVQGLTIPNAGILLSAGTLNVSESLLAYNQGANVLIQPLLFGVTDPYLPPQLTITNRLANAVFDHCDFIQSAVGITTATEAKDPINCTVKNSIFVGKQGIVNQSNPSAHFIVENSDLYTTGAQFTGSMDQTTNVLNVDPRYISPATDNFHIREDSPVAKAGENGTYMGSQGTGLSHAEYWMIYQ